MTSELFLYVQLRSPEEKFSLVDKVNVQEKERSLNTDKESILSRIWLYVHYVEWHARSPKSNSRKNNILSNSDVKLSMITMSDEKVNFRFIIFPKMRDHFLIHF